MVDDSYPNLLSWSVQNIIVVVLCEDTYIRKVDMDIVTQIDKVPKALCFMCEDQDAKDPKGMS